MANVGTQLSGLARTLVVSGLLDEETAKKALGASSSEKIPFVAYLVQNKILDSITIARAVANDFGLPIFDLESIDKEFIPSKIVGEKLIQRHHAIPIFKRGNNLFLAISDPTNQVALDEIQFNTGLKTQGILVEEDKLSSFIDEVLNKNESSPLADLSDLDLEALDTIEVTSGEEESGDDEKSSDDAPIVRFVNKVLLDAINAGASDIHFEPYENSYRVRFRQDGVLGVVATPPTALGSRIASRLKVMARLDISERRIPQDGRFKMQLSKKRAIDFRVSTCPTVGGEKVVMRILDATQASLGIDALGFFEEQKKRFLKAIARPQGMILVTGPTGSGKTVTLYTGLGMLNTVDVNISTAEDPVELNIPGINQVNVNPKTGLTFAAALKSFLRQDPDVVMVGKFVISKPQKLRSKRHKQGIWFCPPCIPIPPLKP